MNTKDIQQQLGTPHPIAVSPSEAAWLFGIGRTTLYAARSSRALASIKIVITIEAIMTWLSNRADRPDQGEARK